MRIVQTAELIETNRCVLHQTLQQLPSSTHPPYVPTTRTPKKFPPHTKCNFSTSRQSFRSSLDYELPSESALSDSLLPRLSIYNYDFVFK
ncbi:hypothetical protein HZ326_29079, partial [Fusarium oxysporum f. sp. albedinis]